MVTISINGALVTVPDGSEISITTPTPSLESILSNTPSAPTESIQVGQVGLRNIDDDPADQTYNTMWGNNNSISFKCNRTGRELTIDWSGETVAFNVIPASS